MASAPTKLTAPPPPISNTCKRVARRTSVPLPIVSLEACAHVVLAKGALVLYIGFTNNVKSELQEILGDEPLLLFAESVTVVLRVTASCRAFASIARRSEAEESRALESTIARKFGTAIAARIASTASVTINSTSVNPVVDFLFMVLIVLDSAGNNRDQPTSGAEWRRTVAVVS